MLADPQTRMFIMGSLIDMLPIKGSIVLGSFFTQTGEIQIRPLSGSDEGGQLTLLGAGTNKYLYFDNFQGRLRLVTQDASGESAKLEIYNNGDLRYGAGQGQPHSLIFLRPSGGDDGYAINTAIGQLPARGGIIVLLPGVYSIQTPIVINKNGVKLRGFGGFRPDDVLIPQPDPATVLLWPSTSAGTVVQLASTISNTFIYDLEISNLVIDCNGYATTGLLLDHVAYSRFVSVHVRNLGGGGVGMDLTTTATAANIDSAWNNFEDCSVFDASIGVRLRTQAPGVANCSHNTFTNLSVRYRGTNANDAGIFLGDCDNNKFDRTWMSRSGGSGNGVVVSDPLKARANYFYHLQAVGGFLIQMANGAPVGYNKNCIFGYDLENQEPQPTATGTDPTTTKYLFWIDSQGNIHGGQLV